MITCLILAFTAIHILPSAWSQAILPLFAGIWIAVTFAVNYKAIRGQLPGTPLDLGLACLTLVAMVSSLRAGSLFPLERIITIWCYAIAYYFICLYVSETMLSENCITSGWVIMATVLALNLYRFQRTTALTGNNNLLASILLLHLPFGSRIEDRRSQVVWFIMGSLAMLSTRSRGAMLGLVWATGNLWRIDRRLLALGTMAVLPVALLWEWDTTMIRLHYWEAAAQAFLSQPILGIGPGNCLGFISPRVGELCPHAHNIFLTVTAEMGVVGLAAFCWLVWQIWRHRRPGPAWSALVGFMVHSLVDDPIWYWAPGLGVMSLLAIVIREGEKEKT